MYHEDHAIEPLPLNEVDASAAFDHSIVMFPGSCWVMYYVRLCAMFDQADASAALDHYSVSVVMRHVSQCWYLLSFNVLAHALFHSVVKCCVAQCCQVLCCTVLSCAVQHECCYVLCSTQWCYVLRFTVVLCAITVLVLVCAMFELVDAPARCVGVSGFRGRGV